MKLEVFKEKDNEKKVLLTLIQDDDEVDLYTVDENGNPDTLILTISKEGIKRHSICETLGIKLDEDDYIKLHR